MVSRPTAAGLFTDSWSPQESRPWSSEGEMGSFSWSRKGPASSVLAVFSGVTKGDLKGVMKATQGVIEDLSCLGLPGGHAYGCEGLLTSPVVLEGQLQSSPSALWPRVPELSPGGGGGRESGHSNIAYCTRKDKRKRKDTSSNFPLLSFSIFTLTFFLAVLAL